MFLQKSWMSFEQLAQLLDIHTEILEITNHALIVTDLSGQFVWVNNNYCDIIGLSSEMLQGKSIQAFLVADDMCYEEIWGKIHLKQKWRGEITSQQKNNMLLHEKAEVSPILNSCGEVSYLVWIFGDVMRKKQEVKRLKREIDMAKNIQSSVLSPAIVDENIEIDAAYFPSEMLAGDMYAWFQIDNTSYGVVLIDVMGHGMASALISMSIRSLLRGMVMRLKDPVKIIDEMNKHMCNLFPDSDDLPKIHLTALCLIIDTKMKTIKYVNAGHPPGYLYSHSHMEALDVGTFVLGAFSNMPISKGVLTYKEKDKIILYTDGLLEVISESPILSKKLLGKYVSEYHWLKNKDLINQLKDDFILAENHLVDDVCFISITLH